MIEVDGLEVLEIDEVRVGDVVTVLQHGRASYDYHVLKVEEVGEDYITGYNVWEEEGELKVGKRPVTVRADREWAIIVRGMANDLIKQIKLWKIEFEGWIMRWEYMRKEIERQLYEQVVKQLEEWEKNNPPPKNPIEALIGKLKTVKHTA